MNFHVFLTIVDIIGLDSVSKKRFFTTQNPIITFMRIELGANNYRWKDRDGDIEKKKLTVSRRNCKI